MRLFPGLPSRRVPALVALAVLLGVALPASTAQARQPSSVLARWLSHQIGGVHVGHHHAARRHAGRARAHVAVKASAAVTTADALTGGSGALTLVRSFEIPASDPAHDRLANLSFTYDSALAAAAFVAAGDKADARRLLDQLVALQRTDGSIPYAFNTASGASSPRVRAGTVAWVGLAGALFHRAFHATRYDMLAIRAASWLRGHRTAAGGLVAGGPDVRWASTQHNLLAWLLLHDLGQLGHPGDAASADELAAAIDTTLLVRNADGSACFTEGAGDPLHPLDAQALGIVQLAESGDTADAAAVARCVWSQFAIGGRSVVQSTLPTSLNTAYSAAGPFSGFRPFADAGAPDVLWAEGSFETRYALQHAGGQDLSGLDASLVSWLAITGDDATGPLGADRTVTTSRFSEYHVWPTSAAASWAIIGASAPKAFPAGL